MWRASVLFRRSLIWISRRSRTLPPRPTRYLVLPAPASTAPPPPPARNFRPGASVRLSRRLRSDVRFAGGGYLRYPTPPRLFFPPRPHRAGTKCSWRRENRAAGRTKNGAAAALSARCTSAFSESSPLRLLGTKHGARQTRSRWWLRVLATGLSGRVLRGISNRTRSRHASSSHT